MNLNECDLSSQVMLSTVEQDDIGVDWVLNKKLQRINKNIYDTLKGTLKMLGGQWDFFVNCEREESEREEERF